MTHNTCPFQLNLNHPSAARLECHTTLRCLPGRRQVCAATWDDEQVVVKLFLDRKAQRYWEREKRGIELLRQRDIATPELLFAGFSKDDNIPVLITRMISGAQTALERWERCSNDNERLDLLKSLVEVIARQHKHGLWQEDLHLGNFLLSADEVFTLDGDAIRAKIRTALLPPYISRGNLSLFFAQIPPPYAHLFEDTLNHYISASGQSLQQWQSLLTTELPQQRRKRRRTYVSKAFRNCTEFTRKRKKGQLLIHRSDAPPELIRSLENDPDSLIEQGTILKNGNSSTVVRVESGSDEWVVKRYNIKNLWHFLKRCLRPTRAAISWGNAHRLKISGINTPQAVAMAEKRFGPLRLTGYYVGRYVEDPDVAEYFSADSIEDTPQIQAATALVRLFELFYNLGIHHGDCKATNFLLNEQHPWVIDLDSMREFNSHQSFLRHYRVDRARFLRNWKPDSKVREWFDKRLPQI